MARVFKSLVRVFKEAVLVKKTGYETKIRGTSCLRVQVGTIGTSVKAMSHVKFRIF